MDRCGVGCLLIGDSLGMVCQGQPPTLPVTVAEIVYHTSSVARGNKTALLIADMPFWSYATPQSCFRHAVQFNAGSAHMVKLEGGAMVTDT